MSSPLRHRSPVKDPEVGPTPKKTGNAAGSASVPTPGTAAAAASPAQQQQPQSFVARNKKWLVLAAVVGIVVIIVAAAAGSRSSASNAAASANRKSRSANSDNDGTDGGWMPGVEDNPNDGNDNPDDEDDEEPISTPKPTSTPAPEIPPIPTNTCKFVGGLGNTSWYNGFFSDYFWTNGSSMEGRLAVAQNAFINQFSIGTNLYGLSRKWNCPNNDISKFRAANYACLIGGGLTLNGTAIFSGGLGYGYVINDVNFTLANTQSGCPLTPGANVLMFGQEFSQARSASDAIANFGNPLSTVAPNAENLEFRLNGSIMTEFFRITEAQLQNTSVFVLKGTPKTYNGTTATIIIDVVMSESNSEGVLNFANWGVQGFNGEIAKNIIWNFNGVRELSFQRGSWYGSILAPDARIENSWGDLWGSVIARSWNSRKKEINVQFHNSIFNGTVFTDDC